MKRIAVIGAGISGMASAYLLSRRHLVWLIERDERLGGHTHTIEVDEDGERLPLDTGFLVHNERTYPHLVRLFAELGVETRDSDMSFSVSCPSTGFEYSSRGPRGFFAQRANLLRPRHYRLLGEIARFNRLAPRLLAEDGADRWTIGDYLEAHAFGDAFRERYLYPMTSAIWSASIDGISRFPAGALVRFLDNHGMLSLGRHPAWKVVRGGSAAYIAPLTRPYRERILTGARICAVTRGPAGITVGFHGRPSLDVDEVVFATHGDQVLPLLPSASDVERDVLGAFRTTRNDCWLHTDESWLPRRRQARASWNYRLGADGAAPPSVTYHLNRLQRLRSRMQYSVTLNPDGGIPGRRVIRRMTYAHPLYTRESSRAQARWAEISGRDRMHYCGAYWYYGFHEDGLRSARRVARALGVAVDDA